ncbi:MAG: hypothetical protein R3281_03335 [Balneolaceae bacterium]|nr:hypothetical protein [Balneolaceae bacterium]
MSKMNIAFFDNDTTFNAFPDGQDDDSAGQDTEDEVPDDPDA